MRQTNTDDFIVIRSFEEAAAACKSITPMKTGPNKGNIPLRISRRNSDTYHIYLNEGQHPLTGERATYYAARMYAVEIIRWWDDGHTVQLSSYNSSTTHRVMNAITNSHWNGASFVTTINGYKCLRLRADSLHPLQDMTLLSGHLNARHFVERAMDSSTKVTFPFDDSDYMTLTVDGLTCVHNHGVYIGRGRKYIEPIHGQLFRAVHDTCRALADFGHDPLLAKAFNSNRRVHGSHMTAGMVDGLIESFNWQPGQPVPADMLEALLDSPQQWLLRLQDPTWHQRLDWTEVLRQTPKATTRIGGNGWPSPDVRRVVTVAEAQELAERIEAKLGTQPELL